MTIEYPTLIATLLEIFFNSSQLQGETLRQFDYLRHDVTTNLLQPDAPLEPHFARTVL